MLATLLVFSMCGCREENLISEATTGEIKVTIVDKGYGVEWLYEIASAYEDAYEGCTVQIVEVTDPDALAAKIRTTANDNDLIISTSSFFLEQYDDYLLELTDVFDTVQDGFETKLIDRMNESVKDYYMTEDGKFYQLPWIFGYGGLMYNKTVLDEALGTNYTLPRTSEELIAFCQDLQTKGVYPFSLSTAVSYWSQYLVGMYFQYQGKEEYENFYRGYYLKNGEYVKATAENFEEYLRSQTGVLESAEVIYELLGENRFGHPESTYMNFQEAQTAFLGLGYGDDRTPCAFMLCGDWFATEMSDAINRSGADVRFMKLPVISSITERLDDKTIGETELRNIISAIDAREDGYDGVSDADYERLKQARFSTTSTASSHVMVIPKMKNGTRKYTLTKQFINYILSYEGQELFTYMMNGITMPYGYTAEGIYGEYADSILDAMGDKKSFTMISEGHNSPLFYVGHLDNIVGYYEGNVISDDLSPADYFNRCVNSSLVRMNQVLPLIN